MGDKPKGMATKGLPKGPEIPDKSQVQEGQPGLRKGMQAQPVSDKLPTQHGDQEVFTLETYRGVGKFTGKVALVTGGDSGIGRAVSVLLAKEAAKAVAIVYLPKEQPDADDARKLIEAEGSQALLIPADLSEGEDTCKGVVKQYVVPSIEETSQEMVEDTFKTNIFPMVYLVKHALPHMARGSSIVNSTSVTAYQGSPSLLAYSATKGAIVSFTRSLSAQLAPKGIRVNAVAAGPVWAPLQAATMPPEQLQQTKQSTPPLGHIGQIWTPLNPASREQSNLEGWLQKEPPLGRIGQPIEAATSYIFLASQEAAFMTRPVLHPNGGYIVNG